MVWLSIPAIAVATFFFGCLPLASFMVRVLTLDGTLYGARYSATVRVFTDIAKGAIAVTLGYIAGGLMGAHVAVLCVYLGHSYPFSKKFGKQKGTGTVLGALTILDPLVGLFALSGWLFAIYIYRHPGFAACVSAAFTTTTFAFISSATHVRLELLIILMALIFWRHRHYVLIRN